MVSEIRLSTRLAVVCRRSVEVRREQDKRTVPVGSRSLCKKEFHMTDFISLVRSMREAQKEYFRTRDANVLVKAKELEAKVDKVISDAEEEDIGPKLF